MARNVWDIYYFGCYRRVVSITTTCICIMCIIPQKGICHEKRNSFKSKSLVIKVLTQVDKNDTDDISDSFNQFDKSEDPFEKFE